jgi:hypothetical protein
MERIAVKTVSVSFNCPAGFKCARPSIENCHGRMTKGRLFTFERDWRAGGTEL